MFDELISQRLDIERLKSAFGNMLKIGPVAAVDAKKGYRIDLGVGSDGAPFLSPWMPHPENGGQSSTWMPLSVGQIVGILSPNGDLTQGLLLRGGFSDENAQPSEDLTANLLQAFGVEISMKDGQLVIKGNVKIEGDFEAVGGKFEHNGVNVGFDHKHKDVTAGGDISGKPTG
jgi:phage baseplate assembly protein gpV